MLNIDAIALSNIMLAYANLNVKEERCKSDNANLVTESVIANNAPSDDDLKNCSALGKAIA